MSQNIKKIVNITFWKSLFGKAYWTSSYKKVDKHLESVHSNSKSNNCPVCDLSFSRIDILERHANHFYEDSMSHNMIKLWLWF